MDRKKTILIAVMINAGLLVLLFIGALVTQDETVSEEIAQKTVAAPLFIESSERVQEISMPSPVVSLPPLQDTLKTIETAAIQETLVHRLPVPVVETAVVAPSSLPAVSERSSGNFEEVTVKKGDSLDKIAKANHVTVDEIVALNQLPGSFLKIGQVLKLPDSKLASQGAKIKAPVAEKLKSTAINPEYYTVKVGDNPWGIAMKHHMKVEELLKLNHLNEEKARKLKPGDRLRIR